MGGGVATKSGGENANHVRGVMRSQVGWEYIGNII